MSKYEANELQDALLKAQQISAIARALHYSWIELSGDEVEILLGMSSEYADSVTEYLINLSGDKSKEGPITGERYTKNGEGSVVIVRECGGDRVVFSYEQYPEASHSYSLGGFLREFTLQGVRHA